MMRRILLRAAAIWLAAAIPLAQAQDIRFGPGAAGVSSSVGGDLSGTLPNPTVIKIGGVAVGTAATVNTGTSGATIPLLNGNNTYSGTNTYSLGALFGASAPAARALVHGYTSANSLQIIGVLENDQGAGGVAALGFSVSGVVSSETRSTKAGIGYQRGLGNGRGTLNFYQRATNDGADFTSSDIVATSFNTGTWQFGAPVADAGQKVQVNGTLGLLGATSGSVTLAVPAAAGSNTVTLPAGTTDFTATGGASQVVKQITLGGALTVGQLAAANLSDGTTGSGGAVVLATAPTISGGAHTALTSLAVRDTSAAFDVTIAGTSSTTLNAGRTLTLDMKNVAHTLAFSATANTITFPNTASYTLVGSGDTGTVTNTMLAGSIATSKLTALAHTQSSVAAPAGTTNTTGLMMGLAGTITPTNSGTVRFTVCGDIANNTLADGANVQLRTGTGTAPINTAALTGTTRGSLVKFVASTAAGKVPFCLQYTVTGLALSTAVWIDVGLAAVTGGTATIADVDIVADEIP